MNDAAKQTYHFVNSATAWQFMRDCDDAGVSAGFPSVDGKHSVTVAAHVLAPGLAHYRQSAPIAD